MEIDDPTGCNKKKNIIRKQTTLSQSSQHMIVLYYIQFDMDRIVCEFIYVFIYILKRFVM